MVEKLKRTVVTSRHSWSKSIIETVNGSHNFTIHGYGLAKGSGPGKYVSSDVFNVGGYDWAVYFYPDGKNPEDSATYVSVFIALASEGTNVRALFELTLMDQSGKGKHKVHSHFDRALESGPYTLKYRGSMWGYKLFFRRVNLESSDYLKNDSLKMHCTVGVVRNRVDGPKLYDIQIPPSNIGSDFKYLLDSGCVQADITFLVGDEKLKAHKLVLAAHSHVFKAQFFGNIGNIGNHNLDEVEVVGIEAAVFKLMLQCIYSSDLPNTSELVYSTSVSTSTIMLQHLLAAADRYDLDRLKLLCEAKLAEEINIDTVAMTLSLAEQHRCLQLKALCLKFAATNMGAVTQTEGFRNLKGSYPRLVSELLETYASTDQNSNAISLSKKRSGRINSSSISSVLGLKFGCRRSISNCEYCYLQARSKTPIVSQITNTQKLDTE